MSILRVDWLGQAGFLYEFPNGTIVAIDPYLSYARSDGGTRERLVPIPIPASQLYADMVITTHDHSDHFDEHTLRPLAENHEIVLVGPSSCRQHWLTMEMPPERFLRLDQGAELTVGGVHLRAVYAEHDSGGQRDAIGVVMEADGLRIYQVGDSECNERLVEETRNLRPDLMTVPINGRLGNMNHQEAARLAQTVEPRVVVPMHYGMFRHNNADPQDFVDACRAIGLGAQIAVMKIGARFHVARE